MSLFLTRPFIEASQVRLIYDISKTLMTYRFVSLFLFRQPFLSGSSRVIAPYRFISPENVTQFVQRRESLMAKLVVSHVGEPFTRYLPLSPTNPSHFTESTCAISLTTLR